jgi:N-methylhydantoinase A
VLSALGLAIAPERRDAATSVMRAADTVDQGWFGARLDTLAMRAANASAQRLAWHARVRYAGQGHELDISCAPGDDGAVLSARFATAHAAQYGFTLERPVEIVAVRVAAAGDAVDVTFGSGSGRKRTFAGPHVETLADATMVVAPGWKARSLDIGGWLVERS